MTIRAISSTIKIESYVAEGTVPPPLRGGGLS